MFQIQQELEKLSFQIQQNEPDKQYNIRTSMQPREMMKVYDLQFIKTQSQPLANQDQKQDFISQNQEKSYYNYESSNISRAQIKQKKTTRFENDDQRDHLDLAFLYADPLVTYTKENRLVEYTVPLDLEIEYQQIIENLKQTNKKFVIRKKAMNTKSLQDIICQNPKIIHISCHGSYDEQQKEFYLSIEDVNPNGKEYKFTKFQLQHILKLNSVKINDNSEINNSSQFESRFQKQGIKLAFVSACQSEEIGNIFLQAGIPVVIAVNSDQEIMDDACKLFSKTFYSQLLKGFSISASFQQAQSNVQLTPNFETCCCAHTHDDDCVWYKFYKQNPIEAHEVHSKQCACQQYGISGRRKHQNVCDALNEFKFFMRKKKELEINNQPKKENIQINEKVQGCKLAFANLQDSDEENFDFEIESKFQVFSIQPQQQEEANQDTDLIMCCCRKHLQHDETMKFILKSNQDEQGNEFKDEQIFDRYGEDGDVIQLGQETIYRNRIPCHIEKKQLFGSQIKIHEIINFLTSNNRNQNRILSLNGKSGSGCSSLARYSVKYVMDRNIFSDGAYYISVENKNSAQSILKEISYQFKLPYNNEKVPFPYFSFKPLQILILIDKCQNIIQNDRSNFNKIVQNLIEQTEFLKIIIISNQQNLLKIDDELSQFFHQIQISPMEKIDTIKMILRICKNQAIQYNSDELSKHQIFNEFQFTPQEVSQICMLIENGTNLDKIYEIQKQKNEQQQFQNGDGSAQQFNFTIEIYQQIQQNNPIEISLFNILYFAPSGLLLHDIFRIVLLNQINSRPDKKQVNFEQWIRFIEDILNQEQFLASQKNSQNQNKIDEKQQILYKSIQFKLIESQESPEVNQYKIKLNNQLTEFMKYQTSEKTQFANEYLKYMSLLSRQLLRDIQYTKKQEFDHYLLTSLINDGIWAEPKQLQYEMIFKDDYQYYSKENMIENAVNYFWFHESNFISLIESFNDIFASVLENNINQDLVILSDEFFTNFVSIYIQLNCISDAYKTIKKIQKICEQYDELLLISIKTQLIQISLELQIKKSDDELRKIGLQMKSIEERAQNLDEFKEIKAEIQYLQAICQFKKIEKLKKNPHNNSQTSNEMNGKFSLHSIYHSDQSQFNLSLSQQSFGLNKHQIGELQLQNDFQNVINLLNYCKQSYASSFGIAKSWLLLAEFIHETVIQNEDLQIFLQPQLKSICISLNKNLEIQKESFQEFNYVQHIKCLLYQSKSLLILQNFQKCKEKVIQCMEYSRKLNQKKLFNDAKEVLDSVSLKMQIKLNNYLIFAQACPINSQLIDQDFIIHKQIHDDVISFKNHLQQSNKQINVKFEILNQDFIRKVKDQGCKVLHITPYMFKIQKENQFLVFEDQLFNNDNITPSQLQQLFQKKIDCLQIQLVIIESINCEEFAKVFLDLGVKNVIFFKVDVQSKCSHEQNKTNKSFHHCSLNSEQNEYLLQQQETLSANLFFNNFFFHFYSLLLQDGMTVEKAIEQAHQNATLYLRVNNRNLSIKPEYICNERQNKPFFKIKQNNESDEDILKEGMLCDISRLKANQNIESNLNLMTQPYLIRQKNYFSQLISILMNSSNDQSNQDQQNQNFMGQNEKNKQKIVQINVFGNKGSGKSRLVLEVAKFLKQRFMFGSGIFHIDLQELNNFNQIYEVLDEFKIQENSKKQKDMIQNDILFIFDNCDEFLKKNKTSFEVNLKFITNRFKAITENTLSIIFVSQERLHEQYKFIPFELEDFGFSKLQSHLFLQIINTRINENQLNLIQKMYEISKGNPQLLQVLNKINQITNLKVDLIDKVQILPLEKLQNEGITKSSNIKQIDGGFSTGLDKLAYFTGEISSSKSIIGTRKHSILVLNNQFEQQNLIKENIDSNVQNENGQQKLILNNSLASFTPKQKIVNEARQKILFQSYQQQRKNSIQASQMFLNGTQVQNINKKQKDQQYGFIKTMKTLQKFNIKKQEFINDQGKQNNQQIPLELGDDFKQQRQSFYLNQESKLDSLKESKTFVQLKKKSLYADLDENEGNSIKSGQEIKKVDSSDKKKIFEEQLDIFDSELEERNDDEMEDEEGNSQQSEIQKSDQKQQSQCQNPSIKIMSSVNLPPINEKDSNEESINLSNEEYKQNSNICINKVDSRDNNQQQIQKDDNIFKIETQQCILNFEGFFIEFKHKLQKTLIVQLDDTEDQNNQKIKVLHPVNIIQALNKKQILKQKTILSNLIPSESKIQEINEISFLLLPKERKFFNRNSLSSNIISEDIKSQQNLINQIRMQMMTSQKSELAKQEPINTQIYEIMSTYEDFQEIESINIYVPQSVIEQLLFNVDSFKRLDRIKVNKRQSIVYHEIKQDKRAINVQIRQPTLDFNKIYNDQKVSDDESEFDVYNPKLSDDGKVIISPQYLKKLNLIANVRNNSDQVFRNNKINEKKLQREYQIFEENIDSIKIQSNQKIEDKKSFIEDFDAFKSDEQSHVNLDGDDNVNDDSKNVWNILGDSSYLQNVLTYSKQSSKFSFLTKNNSELQDSFFYKNQFSDNHIQNDLIEEEERDDIE